MRRRRALIAVLVAMAAALVPARADDRAALMALAAEAGFDAAEEEFLARAADGTIEDAIALAQFYMAHGLWAEARAALRRPGAELSDRARALIGECDYRSGRYADLIAVRDKFPKNDPLLAMALARLGAYADAGAVFAAAAPPPMSLGLTADFFLLKAEALVETGDADAAEAAMRAAAGGAEARRRFISARIFALRGAAAKASAAYRSAAAYEPDDWSMRARLALAADDVGAVETLSLAWRGGPFERDLQLALARLRLAGRDFDRGFAALRRVVDHYPQSDAALQAQEAIAGELARLFEPETNLDPLDASRLFFQHVEFAPPGRDGDMLILAASMKLKELGLFAQSAQLLDHQVFKRLRGARRSTVAADLAELYLSARRPDEALRTLRSTRIAGLDEIIAARRFSLEAQALAANGETAAALEMLSRPSSLQDIRLRGDIHWRRRAWPDAARDYASVFMATPTFASASDRETAVRAATAFLLAGDRAGYRGFVSQAAPRLDGAAEADLIRSLGDVDREQFIANFMSAYRGAYDGEQS